MMKSVLLKLILPLFVFALHACDKADPAPNDVFHVTFAGPSDGCPGGPLVLVQEKDINRLAHLLDMSFRNDVKQVISAINLTGTYRTEQPLTLRFRRLTAEESIFCTANLRWYPGAYVVEEYTDLPIRK